MVSWSDCMEIVIVSSVIVTVVAEIIQKYGESKSIDMHFLFEGIVKEKKREK